MNKDIPKPRPLAYLYITIPKERLDEVEDHKEIEEDRVKSLKKGD